MPFTPAQLATIATNIAASPDLAVQPNTSDGNFEIARFYNLDATPTFWVYKSLVFIKDIG